MKDWYLAYKQRSMIETNFSVLSIDFGSYQFKWSFMYCQNSETIKKQGFIESVVAKVSHYFFISFIKKTLFEFLNFNNFYLLLFFIFILF